MIDYITVAVTKWINLMADRNTTQKDKQHGKVIETGTPRCKNCHSRLSVVEIQGTTKLWCILCDAPRLGGTR